MAAVAKFPDAWWRRLWLQPAAEFGHSHSAPLGHLRADHVRIGDAGISESIKDPGYDVPANGDNARGRSSNLPAVTAIHVGDRPTLASRPRLVSRNANGQERKIFHPPVNEYRPSYLKVWETLISRVRITSSTQPSILNCLRHEWFKPVAGSHSIAIGTMP